MKTTKRVIKEHPDYEELIKDVIDRIDIDNVENINKYGINGGYPGFTYYADTTEFAYQHQDEILQLLTEDANDMGEEVTEMIKHFGAYKGKMDENERKEMYKYLGGGKTEEVQFPNLMAWYAAETVCRWFEGDNPEVETFRFFHDVEAYDEEEAWELFGYALGDISKDKLNALFYVEEI